MSATQILCVDDEALIRVMIADYVEELGLQPLEADSGETALQQLAAHEVALLITDIRMGGISGWELARRARAQQPSLPIIYISGFPSEGEALADTIYLSKPFMPRELQDAILKSLGWARAA